MSRKRHLTAGIALTVGLVALTGSALAAPPSTPPGQEKKAEKQAEQAPPAATTAPATATTAPAPESTPAEKNKGQEQKAAKAQSSNGINATTAGVKPSNNTQKNTTCWTGGSSSSPTCQPGPNADSSKRYGNGKTAAQIAASRGAPANTEIYGPGNSQPHKVCKKVNKNGKEVWADVHAVKSYVGVCETTLQSHSPVTSTSTTTSNNSSTSVTSPTSQTGSTSGTAATGGVAGTAATGGVAGVAVESGSPGSAPQGAAGGVLGAFGVAGVAAGGALPFTGFPVWLAIVVAIALITIGWTLYRSGRPAARELV